MLAKLRTIYGKKPAFTEFKKLFLIIFCQTHILPT